ncbi:hypothetical protein KGQ34_02475 [Patescibacteria group bacterium]|nr:hypothetical protein [Patescibacteria group bacterium]
MENKRFEIISGGEKDDSREQKVAEIETLARQYGCSIVERPMRCVWGNDNRGDHGVLYWIKPAEEDEFVAHKIAKLVTEVGGHAKAKMTEWNPELKGEPIYKKAKNILKI